MTTMISKTLSTYNGKPLKPGERFDVEDERHVRTLVVTKKAEVAALPEEQGGARRYKRRDMTAE